MMRIIPAFLLAVSLLGYVSSYAAEVEPLPHTMPVSEIARQKVLQLERTADLQARLGRLDEEAETRRQIRDEMRAAFGSNYYVTHLAAAMCVTSERAAQLPAASRAKLIESRRKFNIALELSADGKHAHALTTMRDAISHRPAELRDDLEAARWRVVSADAYLAFGSFQKARDEVAAALTMVKAILPAEHPNVALVECQLVCLDAYYLVPPRDAEQRLKACDQAMERCWGSQVHLYGTSQVCLSKFYNSQGKYEQAELHALRSIAANIATDDARPNHLADSYLSLAIAWYQRGYYFSAMTALMKVESLLQKNSPDYDLLRAECFATRRAISTEMAQDDDAAIYASRLLEVKHIRLPARAWHKPGMPKRAGREHLPVGINKELRLRNDDFEKRIADFENSADFAQEVDARRQYVQVLSDGYGPAYHLTTLERHLLASAEKAALLPAETQTEIAQARKFHERVKPHDEQSYARTVAELGADAEALRKHLGTGDIHYWDCLELLSSAHSANNDFSSAEEAHKRLMNACRGKLDNHPRLARYLATYSHTLLRRDKIDQALPLLRQAEAILVHWEHQSKLEYAATQMMLARCLNAMGKHAEAEQAALLSIVVESLRTKPDHSRLAYAFGELGISHVQQGEPISAVYAFKKSGSAIDKSAADSGDLNRWRHFAALAKERVGVADLANKQREHIEKR